MAKKVLSVPNPWLNISWKKTVADIDRPYLEDLVYYDKLQLDTLPEPFTGNPDSQVYCLNLNPGGKDELFESIPTFKTQFLDITQKNLYH